MNPCVAGWRLFACLLIALVVVGCEVEKPTPPPSPASRLLVPVHGKVTVDGKPLAGASVFFLPAFSDAGAHCAGETDANGEFELATLYQPGASAGDYRVSVSYMVTPSGRVVSLADRDEVVRSPELNEGEELIPPHYNDFSKTELRATVRRDGPPIDFPLKGPLRKLSTGKTPFLGPYQKPKPTMPATKPDRPVQP